MIYKIKIEAYDNNHTYILPVIIKTLEIKDAAKRLSGFINESDAPYAYNNLYKSLYTISDTTQKNNKETAPAPNNISANIRTILDAMQDVPQDIKGLLFEGIRFGQIISSNPLSPTPEIVEQMMGHPAPSYREYFTSTYNSLPLKTQIEDFNISRNEYITELVQNDTPAPTNTFAPSQLHGT
ncbi:MAG: hypothetical protein LBN07_01570 [Christensenellaceae bacterium]|nr:hypothetical protein [Christensenellaceae bacterium]